MVELVINSSNDSDSIFLSGLRTSAPTVGNNGANSPLPYMDAKPLASKEFCLLT